MKEEYAGEMEMDGAFGIEMHQSIPENAVDAEPPNWEKFSATKKGSNALKCCIVIDMGNGERIEFSKLLECDSTGTLKKMHEDGKYCIRFVSQIMKEGLESEKSERHLPSQ